MIVAAEAGLRFEDGDDIGRIIVSGAETDGRYALMDWTVAAASNHEAGFGPHLHRACEETFLIREGSLEFLLGEAVTLLHAGDFVRVPPGVRHGYRNVSGQPVEMLVGFHPAGLETLFVKYRTDQDTLPDGDGFIADATRLFDSEFEI